VNDLREFFAAGDWTIVHEESRPAKPAEYTSMIDLPLSAEARRLTEAYPNGIYAHQHEAIRRFLGGSNVAITTATASGKTLVFHACAVDLLSRRQGVVVALYPLKALGNEQALRWQHALSDAGLDAQVGYIDGSVGMAERLDILARCRVVVMTPDIMHAWLLRKTAERNVTSFVRRIDLLVIDEAHAYTSVFGSNSAFVFRRLAHARSLSGGEFRYIAASATMDDPLRHLEQLTGRKFDAVGEEFDTAPKAEVTTLMVRPARSDGLTALARLVAHAAEKTSHKTIAFVDGRQLAEHAAVIAGRPAETDDEELPTDIDDPNDDPVGSLQLPRNSVLPYRSGYDDDDRRRIHHSLAKGRLRAVVSTSALELGIDIPGLTLCVLYGVPPSGSSFRQRSGRVGRAEPGLVVIIDDGSPRSTSVFANPTQLWELPLTRSSLYLHNRQAQYIHAMCLARFGGEDQEFARSVGAVAGEFARTGLFPPDFVELCIQERNGSIPVDLRQMKEQAGDNPNLAFPLRDIGQQFQIGTRRGPDEIKLGSLSYAQLMREAYPGAVYYHRANAYRVTRVGVSGRTVNVRNERRYFTKPTRLPLQIFPNVQPEDVFVDVVHDRLRLTECNLNIRESVVGFRERRGGNEFNVVYPLDASLGLYFDQTYFNRTIFTSGVIISHPALDEPGVELAAIGEFVLEAFLMEIPFDRQDIGVGFGSIRQEVNGFSAGLKFICLYDKQHSLRLSGELISENAVKQVMDRAHEMCLSIDGVPPSTCCALRALADDGRQTQVKREAAVGIPVDERFVPVLLPGEIGVDVSRDNTDFKVTRVFYHPLTKLSYRGVHVSDAHRAVGRPRNGDAETILAVDLLRPIPGQSKLGWYDLHDGEVLEHLPGEF
jgi:DEAD/DEAH box helicase domain-containing protein